MGISDQLFLGERIRLDGINYDTDPAVAAGWTKDSAYQRLIGAELVHPLSAEHAKKKYEELEKEADEKHNFFHYQVRTLASEAEPQGRLIGFAEFYWMDRNHGASFVRLGIGSPADWGQGYGSETMRLMLRLAFNEINLHRLSALVPEDNTRALGLFQKFGFVEEIRRREAFHRDRARWDAIHLGLLRREWLERQEG